MMPTAPIAPVQAAPMSDTPVAREEAAEGAGFDQALKEEIAALEPEDGNAPAEDPERSDPVTQTAVDNPLANAAQSGAEHTLSHLVPTLSGLPGASLPGPTDVPVGAAALVGSASALTPSGTAGEPSRNQPALMPASEDVPTEWQESPDTQSSDFERSPLDQLALGAASEQAQMFGRDAGSNPGDRKPSASDAATMREQLVSTVENPTLFAANVSERATVAEIQATVHSTTPLEGLASASLLSKWNAAQALSSEVSPAVTSARIDTPLGTPGWAEGFQQKIVWLVDRQQQSAELHINPPHLGPVEIMLNIGDDGARIALCSPHASVRAAIEASLPELRAAFDEHGLMLGEATVSADSGAAREQFTQARSSDSAPEGGAPAALVTDGATLQVTRRGLVDTFA